MALKTRSGLIVAALFFCALKVYALPVDVEIDRYTLAAQQKYDALEYAAAKDYFEKLIQLGAPLTGDMKFFYGRSLVETGDFAGALTQLTQYIEEAGKDGAHYQPALEFVTFAEERMNEKVANVSGKASTEGGAGNSLSPMKSGESFAICENDFVEVRVYDDNFCKISVKSDNKEAVLKLPAVIGVHTY